MTVQLTSVCHCHDARDCWHVPSTHIKTFWNNRLLIENPKGYVRAVDPQEVKHG